MMTLATPGTDRSIRARVEKWVPGLHVVRTYQRTWLPRDLIAGVVLSALLVPQGMAYAELAGLPAITGLYTTVVCLLAYAAFGPSPYLVLGPDSSLGPMIAAAILPLAAGDTEYAIALAGMLALLVGALCAGAGIARLGFVADLISKPVRIGYLAGLAITIFVGQLPKLFGFSVDADGLVGELVAVLTNLNQTNPWTLAVGLLTLAIILVLGRRAPGLPRVLIAAVTAIAATVLFNLTTHGVEVIGVLPQGFPLPSFPAVELADIPVLAATAIGMTLLVIGDSISTSTGFAVRRGNEVNGDQELVGIGSANLLAGLFQGFPISTSSSRTAVAEQSGARTQLTGVVAALSVLVMLLFVPGLVRNMPQSALAAIVIAASISLFDLAELRRLWTVRRGEFYLALASILGVALVGVLEGIAIAVVLSIFQVFARAWRPYYAILGKPKHMDGYHDLERHPEGEQIPGLLMLRWDAPLFFANANIFRKLIREKIAAASPAPFWVLITAEPVTDVDTTAADMLVDLDEELNASGIHLVFAELKDPVREKIERYGLMETIDRRHFYPTLEVAVEEFNREVNDARNDERVAANNSDTSEQRDE
jgi:high affinity sulfate transporter 1